MQLHGGREGRNPFTGMATGQWRHVGTRARSENDQDPCALKLIWRGEWRGWGGTGEREGRGSGVQGDEVQVLRTQVSEFGVVNVAIVVVVAGPSCVAGGEGSHRGALAVAVVAVAVSVAGCLRHVLGGREGGRGAEAGRLLLMLMLLVCTDQVRNAG